MRRSKLWLMLILIELVLLLSDARTGNGQPRNPDTNPHKASSANNKNSSGQQPIRSNQSTTDNTAQKRNSQQSALADVGHVVEILSTFFIALFTALLFCTSIKQWRALNQQVTLMQANFDQWIELNWRCTGKAPDNELKVWVDLLNPTGFPMKFTGYVSVANDKRHFEDEVLSPKSPKSVSFDISTADNKYGPINRPVTARFTHLHKITQTPVPEDWEGTLECIWWGLEHKWHANFTRFAAHTEH